MVGDPDEPWRLPALKKFGEQFGELEAKERAAEEHWRLPALKHLGEQFRQRERQERRRSRGVGRRFVRHPQILAAGSLLAAGLAVLFAVISGPARAGSVINEAPAAAAKSTSVQFSSEIGLTVGGRQLQRFSQTGAIDFSTGAYRTRLDIPAAETAIEWRTVSAVVYLAARRQRDPHPQLVKWLAVRLTKPQRATLASAPESDALTDPLAILRLLANIRAPIKRVGADTIAGTPTTKYRLSTDLAAVLQASQAAGASPATYRRVTATLEVWLDKRGRPRRVIEDLTGQSARGPVSLRTSVGFGAYGSPVNVAAPSGVTPSASLRAHLPRPLAGAPSHTFERLVLYEPPASRL